MCKSNVIKMGSEFRRVDNKIADVAVKQPFRSVRHSGKLTSPIFKGFSDDIAADAASGATQP